MKQKVFGMAAVMIFAASFYGCASYTATAPVNPGSTQTAISLEGHGIKATVLPIQRKEDAKKFFDYENLSEGRGIYAHTSDTF